MHDPIFQRTLQDLIKGIRNHKRDPSGFISQAIVDIKNELKAIDTYVKAEAVSVSVLNEVYLKEKIGPKINVFANDWV
jgi:AP-3 complex subunit delta-1